MTTQQAHLDTVAISEKVQHLSNTDANIIMHPDFANNTILTVFVSTYQRSLSNLHSQKEAQERYQVIQVLKE